MLENLKIKNKLRIFPVLFIVVMIIIFSIYSLSNKKSKLLLSNIQLVYVPSVEISNNLNYELINLQRMFQDAVAAADIEKLNLTREKYDTIKAKVENAKSNIINTENADLAVVDEEFESYYNLAIRTSLSMIKGEFSEELSGDINLMIEKFNIIKEALANLILQSKQASTNAFAASVKNFNRSFVFIIIILVLSLTVVLWISVKIASDLIGSISDIRDKLLHLSEGKLSLESENNSVNQNDEIGEIVKATKSLISKLRSVIFDVQSAVITMAETSDETRRAAVSISSSANEQATSVEEVSATMEEMTSNIENNSENARETEGIAKVVTSGIKKVSTASEESLRSVHHIAEKIGVINVIAARTDILAINAAVEAARAGSYGDGFAVVAAEVRKLAERTKIAADEIVSLASQSVKVTEDSGRLLGELIPEIEKTTKLVQEIAAGSLEQNEGAVQVNNAIQQLNSITQENASTAEQMSASAESMAEKAGQLKEIISFFKIQEAN